MKENAFKPADKSALHSDVLNQMIDAIKKGTWEPGRRLPGEQLLAGQFEVSRNCIREVLKALALSGVLEARRGSGTFLSPNALRHLNGNELMNTMFDEASLRELIETRCLIEGQIAFWAAERATRAQISELKKTLDIQEPTPESYTRFHDALSEIAGNRLLTRFLESIHNELNSYRRHFREQSGETPEESTLRHLKIYEHIKARNPARAKKAMIEHLISRWRFLIQEKKTQNTALPEDENKEGTRVPRRRKIRPKYDF